MKLALVPLLELDCVRGSEAHLFESLNLGVDESVEGPDLVVLEEELFEFGESPVDVGDPLPLHEEFCVD